MIKGRKAWLAGGAALLLAAIVLVSVSSKNRNAVTVQTAKVERRDMLISKVKASGEIRAKHFVDLQSEVAGIITEIPVREGDSVKKGEILLRIDPIQTAADSNSRRAQYEASTADARAQQFLIMNAEANLMHDEASLRSAQATVEQAQNNFTRSQSSYRRKQLLHEDGLLSRDDYEAAQNDYKTAQSQLEVAQSQLAQIETQVRVARNNIEQNKTSAAASLARAKSAEADMTRADDQLKKTVLVSPLDGVITQLLVEKGERAQPGIMSNPEATLMTIADLSVIQAELKVDETDVVNVSKGNLTKVKVDALPDETFDGEVTEIGNSPIKSTSGSTQQEAKDFKVIVTLKVPSSKLRPGMSCTGEITTDTRRRVLVIPIQALTVRDVEVDAEGRYHEPALGAKKPAAATGGRKKELEGVFVINQNRLARFRSLKTGITGESEIEVIENLKEGEEVVSGSFQTLRTLKDGEGIRVDNSSKSASKS